MCRPLVLLQPSGCGGRLLEVEAVVRQSALGRTRKLFGVNKGQIASPMQAFRLRSAQRYCSELAPTAH
jgi:hypothetical protein